MLNDFLLSLAERTPMVLLALVAIVIAIVRWRRHPGVSGLTVVAFLLYLFRMFVFAFLFQWLPRLHLSSNAFDTFFVLMGVFSDLFFAGVLLMLVFAAFSKRQEPSFAI